MDDYNVSQAFQAYWNGSYTPQSGYSSLEDKGDNSKISKFGNFLTIGSQAIDTLNLQGESKNSLDSTMQNIRSGVGSSLISSGNPIAMAIGAAIKLTDATGGFSDASKGLGSGTDTLNAIGSLALPGAGWFLKPTDTYKMSDSLAQSSGYAGAIKTGQTAEANAGAKLIAGRGKANSMIKTQRLIDNKVSNIIGYNNDLMQANGLNAQDQSMNTKNKQSGGWQQGSISFGRGGLKIEDKEHIAEIARRAQARRAPSVDARYQGFLDTLPRNLSHEGDGYNMRRYWELNGKPSNFMEAQGKNMFFPEWDGFHATSVAYNPDYGIYEFMKSPDHPSIRYETDWYNSDAPDAIEFRKQYKLYIPEDGSSYKYIPRNKSGGIIGAQSVIPGGALHARKHNLKDLNEDLAKQVTHKGVPVVSFEFGGEVEQHAEIERGEIIFRKEITEQLEALWKDGSDDAAIQAGKLIADEICNNTIDKSGEYEIENKK